MTRLLDTGLVRSIANFKPAHLERLFAACFIPHVNQIQLDPTHRRDDIVATNKARGIVTESWSPIGRGGGLLGDPAVAGIAEQLQRSPRRSVCAGIFSRATCLFLDPLIGAGRWPISPSLILNCRSRIWRALTVLINPTRE